MSDNKKESKIDHSPGFRKLLLDNLKSCDNCLINKESRCNPANEMACRIANYSAWQPIQDQDS